MERLRVLLADDHVMFMEGLRSILNPYCDVVGTAENSSNALAAADRLRPDVIVLDISIPEINGIRTARLLQERGTSAKIIFCTMHSDPVLVEEAFRIGAAGYVLKTDAGGEIIAAIAEVAQGRKYVSARMRRRMSEPTDYALPPVRPVHTTRDPGA